MILVHFKSDSEFTEILEGNAQMVYAKLYDIKSEKMDGNWIAPMSNSTFEWHNRYDGGKIEGDGKGNFSRNGKGDFIEAYYIFFTREGYNKYFNIKAA